MNFGEALPDELVLVFDSWSRSFQKSPWAGCVRNCDYPKVMEDAMTEITDRGARVLVGWSNTEDGERRVMGYSVSDPARKILHWLYMKDNFRGCGFGRQLLAETVRDWPRGGWLYTFRTRASARFLGDRFTWDPVPARVRYERVRASSG